MLDFDLAALYGVETRALKQAVRRNRDRFPQDFMFMLTEEETGALVSQSVIPGRGKLGGAVPYAFTDFHRLNCQRAVKRQGQAKLNVDQPLQFKN